MLSNETTVRVWNQTNNENQPIEEKNPFSNRQGNPGHVSIETNNFYASFWPTGRAQFTLKGAVLSPLLSAEQKYTLFSRRPGGFTELEEDEKSEAYASGLTKIDENARKPADRIIVLNTLNIEAMEKLLEKYKKLALNGRMRWTPLGRSFVNFYVGESCSSIAFSLLEAGGIKNLVSYFDTKVLFVKPGDVGDLAEKAKKAEQEKEVQILNQNENKIQNKL